MTMHKSGAVIDGGTTAPMKRINGGGAPACAGLVFVAEDGTVSRAQLAQMLLQDRELAYEEGTPAAAVAATVALYRICGPDTADPDAVVSELERLSDDDLAQRVRDLEEQLKDV